MRNSLPSPFRIKEGLHARPARSAEQGRQRASVRGNAHQGRKDR